MIIYDKEASARIFIKKESLAQMFSCEFCKISYNTIFTEHLQAIPSVTPLEF